MKNVQRSSGQKLKDVLASVCSSGGCHDQLMFELKVHGACVHLNLTDIANKLGKASAEHEPENGIDPLDQELTARKQNPFQDQISMNSFFFSRCVAEILHATLHAYICYTHTLHATLHATLPNCWQCWQTFWSR